MSDLGKPRKNYLKQIDFADSERHGIYIKMNLSLFTLPFLRPSQLVVYQAILIQIQVLNETKVSLCHSSLKFLTNTSIINVRRAIEDLSELGLLVKHPRKKHSRKVNFYSMPEIDVLFEKIRLLNLKYIEKEKPNERIAQIKSFIYNNNNPFKHKQSKSTEETKELAKPNSSGLLETEKPQDYSTTRSKCFYQMLHKLRFFNNYLKLIDITKHLTEEEVIYFADRAKNGRNKIGLFMSLVKGRKLHVVEDGYINPFIKYREQKEAKKNENIENFCKKYKEKLNLSESFKSILKESGLICHYLYFYEKTGNTFTESKFKNFLEKLPDPCLVELKAQLFTELLIDNVNNKEDKEAIRKKLHLEEKRNRLNISESFEKILDDSKFLDHYLDHFEKTNITLTESKFKNFLNNLSDHYSEKLRVQLFTDLISNIIDSPEALSLLAIEGKKKMSISSSLKKNLIESNLWEVYAKQCQTMDIDLSETDFELFKEHIELHYSRTIVEKDGKEDFSTFEIKSFIEFLTNEESLQVFVDYEEELRLKEIKRQKDGQKEMEERFNRTGILGLSNNIDSPETLALLAKDKKKKSPLSISLEKNLRESNLLVVYLKRFENNELNMTNSDFEPFKKHIKLHYSRTFGENDKKEDFSTFNEKSFIGFLSNTEIKQKFLDYEEEQRFELREQESKWEKDL